MTTPGLWLHGAEIEGATGDISIRGTAITGVGCCLPPEPGDEVLECAGGAVIAGLHDHHIHLLSAAAEASSLRVGPPDVTSETGLRGALAAAARSTAPGSWIRAVGYHDSVAGYLDRQRLDRMIAANPVRVQHRSGALWILNTQACAGLGIHSDSGRLYGVDDMIRQRLGSVEAPDLASLSARLAAYGVTGVTDATPSADRSSIDVIARAVRAGEITQHVVVMGGVPLASAEPITGVEWGPVKIVIADHDLPDPAGVAHSIRTAHRHGRPAAIHCVTAVALAIALAAWAETGVLPGDRVEHGSVISSEAAERVAEMGIAVVTQPGLVAQRGDQYLTDVEPGELGDLYRCASLLALGTEVGGSTDAPFGALDPWLAIRAAVERRTPTGVVMGGAEGVDPKRALELFLSHPARPGGPARRVAVAGTANLCLLDAPLGEALHDLSSDRVVATVAGGRVIFRRSG